MPREVLSGRVQGPYKRVVENQANDLNRSIGYILEHIIQEYFKDKLPRDIVPGKRFKDNEA